jgi:hypothetical protein
MGHNELLLREALRGRDRDRVVLSVKFGLMRGPGGAIVGLDGRPAASRTPSPTASAGWAPTTPTSTGWAGSTRVGTFGPGGIGYQTARVLARQGARVLMLWLFAHRRGRAPQ